MGFSRQEYWSGVPLPSPLSMNSRSKTIFKNLYISYLFFKRIAVEIFYYKHENLSILILEMLSLKD